MWPSVWQPPKLRVPRCHVAAHQSKGRGPSGFWPITLLAYIRATVPRLPHRTPHFRHFQPLSLLPPELLRRRSSPKPFSPANFCGDRTAKLRLSPFLACATLFLSDVHRLWSSRATARHRRQLLQRTSAARPWGTSAARLRLVHLDLLQSPSSLFFVFFITTVDLFTSFLFLLFLDLRKRVGVAKVVVR